MDRERAPRESSGAGLVHKRTTDVPATAAAAASDAEDIDSSLANHHGPERITD